MNLGFGSFCFFSSQHLLVTALFLAPAGVAMRSRSAKFIGLIVGLCGLAVSPAMATLIGDVQVCYNCSNSFGLGVLDGPIFELQNTSGTAISNITFNADIGGGTQDTFKIGTLVAGGNAFVVPGVTSDGQVHSTGQFFFVTGSILDTSDTGPNSGATGFEVTGLQGGLPVDSGLFTPGSSKQPSNDGTIASMNFLGNPDGACNDCYGPAIVTTLSTSDLVGVPEPTSFALIGSALVVFGAIRRRRKRE